jgi:hypothetical protein
VRPQRNASVVFDTVDDKAVLVDPSGRELITLNRVGTLVWQLLDGSRDLADLSRAVATDFPAVPADRVAADVEAFVTELALLGLATDGPAPG